jgi:hypothetical protein
MMSFMVSRDHIFLGVWYRVCRSFEISKETLMEDYPRTSWIALEMGN